MGPRNDYVTKESRILVIGKAGSGKSSLCNALNNREDRFAVARGMSTGTTTAQSETSKRNKFEPITVIDTPDITNCRMNDGQRQDEVDKWRKLCNRSLTAVLLTICCSVRYTKEEHDIYKEIVRRWGDSTIKTRLIVVFTFGDQLSGSIENEIKGSSPELKSVLGDADQTYFVFNKKNEDSRERMVHELYKVIQTRERKRRTSTSPESDRERHSLLNSTSRTSPDDTERGLRVSKTCTSFVSRNLVLLILVALLTITAILCIVTQS